MSIENTSDLGIPVVINSFNVGLFLSQLWRGKKLRVGTSPVLIGDTDTNSLNCLDIILFMVI